MQNITILEDERQLIQSVSNFRRYVGILVLLVFGIYLGWFYFKLGNTLSFETDAWGQFGDFVGGLLNPVIAYAAFHWVTQSVLIQGKELAESRQALHATAKAQVKLAEYALTSLKISAINTIIQGATSNIEFARREAEFVTTQYSKLGVMYQALGLDGTVIPPAEIAVYLEKKKLQITALSDARDLKLSEMENLLTLSNIVEESPILDQ